MENLDFYHILFVLKKNWKERKKPNPQIKENKNDADV